MTAAGSGRSTPITATLATGSIAASAVKQETVEEDVQMAGEGDEGEF